MRSHTLLATVGICLFAVAGCAAGTPEDLSAGQGAYATGQPPVQHKEGDPLETDDAEPTPEPKPGPKQRDERLKNGELLQQHVLRITSEVTLAPYTSDPARGFALAFEQRHDQPSPISCALNRPLEKGERNTTVPRGRVYGFNGFREVQGRLVFRLIDVTNPQSAPTTVTLECGRIGGATLPIEELGAIVADFKSELVGTWKPGFSFQLDDG